MLTVILTIAGFLLGIFHGFYGFYTGLFGAAIGFCIGRIWTQASALDALSKKVSSLQDDVLSLRIKLRYLETQGPPPAKVPAPEAAAPAAPPPQPAPAEVYTKHSIVEEAAEQPVAPGERVNTPPPTSATAPTSTPEPAPRPRPAPRKVVAPKEPGFDPFSAAWRWLTGGNTVVRVGVVVLFFGLAFLVKFATEHVTVPIELRYTGVGLAALVALIIGWRLRETRPDYAMPVQGLAIATFYLTLFTGYRVHGLFPSGLVLGLLVATCVLSAALAILQNTRTLAIVGICGGFLAPVLASTGSGNHVALFSYYALLNAGIFGIAWFKAWRPLNVLGFLFTFGIGSLWGKRSYTDALFASTEPFLLLFFFFYLAIALLYARRRQEENLAAITVRGERVDYVDGTLIFGVPIAAFGLQYLMVRDMPFGTALSALGLGLVYVPLAALLYRRGKEEAQLLVESFLALGVIFLSLAIPLALDAQWTSAAWAAEGAGIYWVCCRQQRPVGRAFALLLQCGAGISFLRCLGASGTEGLFGLQTVLDGPVLGALLVGGAGILTGRLTRKYHLSGYGISSDLADDLGILWGLFFLNITPLLLLDMQWSALVWAVVGVTALKMGLRQGRMVAPAFGILLQIVGGVAFHDAAHAGSDVVMFANSYYFGFLVFSVCGFISGLALARATYGIVGGLALLWSLAWWTVGGLQQIDQHIVYTLVLAANLFFLSATAWLLLVLARSLDWLAPRTASVLLLPALLVCGLYSLFDQSHPGANYGWLMWPLAGFALWLSLYRQSALPRPLLTTAHMLGFWLFALLGIVEGAWVFRNLGDTGSAWPIFGASLVPMLLLWLLSRSGLQARWPLQAFPVTYRLAALPLALGLWLWLFNHNLHNTGDAGPLPYLPLLNPLDLAVGISLLMLFGWLRSLPVLSQQFGRYLLALGLGGSAFLWLNGVLLRSLHHWAGVGYEFHAIMQSTLAQAALSLFWAMLALTLMLFATRRLWRSLWLAGGGLMVLVVVKLFLIDLSRVGTVERIVSFIGVGLLLLVIGYFSPVPPKRKEEEAA